MNLNQDYLNDLITQSRAVAMAILHEDSITTRAGGLSEQGFQSLKAAVLRYWSDIAQQDINRYVGLSLDNRFFLVFAKFLPIGEQLLGLVFPLQVPLIRIRQDMTEIQRAIVEFDLKSPDMKPAVEQSLHIDSIQNPGPDQDKLSTHRNTGWHPELHRGMDQSEEIAVPQKKKPQPEEFHDRESASTKRYLTYGAPMKGTPQIPQQGVRSEYEDIPWLLIEEPIAEPAADHQEPSMGDFVESWQSPDETMQPGDDLANILQGGFEPREELTESIGWELPPEDTPETQLQPGGLDEEDTSPIDIHDKEDDWEEDISDTTFYLVPGLETDYILGKLSQRLKAWLPAICERYGWELSLLVVRPDYLKWTLNDFPGSLIHKMLRAVRQETSERIFRTFPELQTENEGGDYWSPGYLVDSQNRDFPTQALIAHFSQDRMGSA